VSLAEDLVTAAAQALYVNHSQAREVREFRTDATAVVVAVLKRLASKPDGYLRHQEDGGITYTRTLRELAEDIEGDSRG
jgi:hypothetical protein